MEKIKNKLLHRSASAMLERMVDANICWQNGIWNMQFQVQDEETKREFWKAIDHMKNFVHNIS